MNKKEKEEERKYETIICRRYNNIRQYIYVAADSSEQAEEIAIVALENGEWDPDYSSPDIDTYIPWYYIGGNTEVPFGIEEYITVNEYLEKYNKWLKEQEIEAKQLELFSNDK